MNFIKKFLSAILVLPLCYVCCVQTYAGKRNISLNESRKNQFVNRKEKKVFISVGGMNLIKSLSSKNFNQAKKLIRGEIELWDRDDNLCTPLHYAVQLRNFEIVKMLVDKGLDVNEFDRFTRTPLALSTDQQISDFLIQKGAKVDLVELNRRDSSGDPLLKKYVIANDLEKVCRLLLSGAEPNIIDRSGRNSLCFCKTAEMARLLMKFGVTLTLTDHYVFSPIENAIVSNNFEVFKLLLNSIDRKNLNFLDGSRMIIKIIEYGNVDMLKYVMDEYTFLNCKSSNIIGQMLNMATKSNKVNIVMYLLSIGANINFLDSNRNTPLHIAIKNGYALLASRLIYKGADTKIRNRNGKTAFDLAKRKSLATVLQML